MWLLNEEDWPRPVEAYCEGVVTLLDKGHLQAYVLLRDPVEIETGGCSGLGYLKNPGAITCAGAPLADLYEIECLPTDR